MQEFDLISQCGGPLHCRLWLPNGHPRAVVQLVHGIAEHTARYDHFARYLTEHDLAVAAEDHMGHGGSISKATPQGCFAGGWQGAVEDVHILFEHMQMQIDAPFFLLGHSMGSFLTRSFLIRYPETRLRGAILSGTAWQPNAVLLTGRAICRLEICRHGEQGVSHLAYNLAFGAYNRHCKPARTSSDWISRDEQQVDLYNADPLCGFVPSVGLLSDMMQGIAYNQKTEHLQQMNPALPVLFMSGDKDPVGSYGKGVIQSARAFERAGMQDIGVRLWPGGRHEMLNEINRDAVYRTVLDWLNEKIQGSTV